MSIDRQMERAAGLLREPSARSGIASFIVMDVMRAANKREAAGELVIHMEVGQPATPAPKQALEAAKNALDSDRLGYTEALGLPDLRTRIARHYGEIYGLDIDSGRVVVTTGSSAGFVLAFLALFDAGARVALPSPGYPCYRHILGALGLEPVTIETNSENRWTPTTQDLSTTAGEGGLDGLLIASPSNPTGVMLTDGELGVLVRVCETHGAWFISDEIYHGLTYERPATTALAHSNNAIVISSFSKYFSMTGWRVGWMIVPDGLVRPLERLAQNLFISTPTLSQIAALHAFDSRDELEGHRHTYAANRALLLSELPKAGFTNILPADGAFYLYADISSLSDDSRRFASDMLREAGVAVTPGHDFDPTHGHRYIRFSYARSTDDMKEAARRLKAWLG